MFLRLIEREKMIPCIGGKNWSISPKLVKDKHGAGRTSHNKSVISPQWAIPARINHYYDLTTDDLLKTKAKQRKRSAKIVP